MDLELYEQGKTKAFSSYISDVLMKIWGLWPERKVTWLGRKFSELFRNTVSEIITLTVKFKCKSH